MRFEPITPNMFRVYTGIWPGETRGIVERRHGDWRFIGLNTCATGATRLQATLRGLYLNKNKGGGKGGAGGTGTLAMQA